MRRNGDPGAERREWLEVRQNGQAAGRVEVGSGPLRIGRAPENQVVLGDTYASGRHAEVVVHQGARAVRDLGSTNGTRLNGRALVAGDPHPLRDGDVIQIGDSALVYRLGASGSGPSPRARAEPPPPRPKRRSLGRSPRAYGWRSRSWASPSSWSPSAWLLAPSRVVILVHGQRRAP